MGKKIKKYRTYSKEFDTLQKTEADRWKDLASIKEDFGQSNLTRNTSTRPRPRPTESSAGLRSDLSYTPMATRRSMRQIGQGTESASEEQMTKAIAEAATKSKQATKEGSQQRLRYPFEEVSGGVNVFQSDIDKLDDGEFCK